MVFLECPLFPIIPMQASKAKGDKSAVSTGEKNWRLQCQTTRNCTQTMKGGRGGSGHPRRTQHSLRRRVIMGGSEGEWEVGSH